MIFSETSLNEKKEGMIMPEKTLLYKVVYEYMPQNTEIHPFYVNGNGGGATLFMLKSADKSWILKVKKSSIFVESKLEEEENFILESGLFHEYKMLCMASEEGVHVPSIGFFCQAEGYDFLALEYIPKMLLDVLREGDIEQGLRIWSSITCEVKKLFNAGIVHCDLHENNICCNGENVFLIDFEEAREISQDTVFEKSLDYIGYNRISTLGKNSLFMEQKYSIPYNCLMRLKEIFDEIMAEKIYEFTQKCNYDSSNGICTTLDHGKSNKVYQGIKTKYFVIGGQRYTDTRIKMICGVCETLYKDAYSFVDVGSNNGLFGREVAKRLPQVIRCIGLEGFHNFNVLAKGIAFLDNITNTEYYDFLCGEDDLDKLCIQEPVVLSMCSVWHHIKRKDVFLAQLKKLNIQSIFIEMATQEGLYGNYTWEEEIDCIMNALDLKGKILLGYTDDYNRPILILSKEEIGEKQRNDVENKITHILKKPYFEKNENTDKNGKHQWVCFGAGQMGRKAIQFLEGNIKFFMDNNPNIDKFENYKVYVPDEGIELIDEETTIVISTDPQYYNEILHQLNSLNINNIVTFEELLENGYLLRGRS